MAETSPPIRILIAEDQSLVRGALVALLATEPDIEVVAQCATGNEVAGLVAKHNVEVALLDIEMPGKSGLDVAEELSGSPCKCLIVTTFGRGGYVKRAIDTNIAGFIVKDTPPRTTGGGNSPGEGWAPGYRSCPGTRESFYPGQPAHTPGTRNRAAFIIWGDFLRTGAQSAS